MVKSNNLCNRTPAHDTCFSVTLLYMYWCHRLDMCYGWRWYKNCYFDTDYNIILPSWAASVFLASIPLPPKEDNIFSCVFVTYWDSEKIALLGIGWTDRQFIPLDQLEDY